MQQKQQANWTEVHYEISTSGIKRSFYFSDKGAIKVTRHTDKGEQIVLMIPGIVLDDLREIMPCELVDKLYALHQAAKEEFNKNKEQSKIAKQVAAKVNKALSVVQASKDALLAQGFTVEQVNALFGKAS